MYRLLLIVTFVLATPGCIAFYSTRPVKVCVTVRETGQGVGRVPVRIVYLYKAVLNAPSSVVAETDSSGCVVVPVTDHFSSELLAAGRWKLTPQIIQHGGKPEELRNSFEPPSELTVELTPVN